MKVNRTCEGAYSASDAVIRSLLHLMSKPCYDADVNSDCNVNVTDLLALLAAWGAYP